MKTDSEVIVTSHEDGVRFVGVEKADGETWKDVSIRLARPVKHADLAADLFDHYVGEGLPEDEACLQACSDLGVCQVFEGVSE